jgi:WhiB family transcriptional regulator, redox-sensing transcriptional regulator
MERSRMPDISAAPYFLPVGQPEPDASLVGAFSGQGTCVGEDPDIFPANGDPGSLARQVCSGCLVRADCLEYAIDADKFGIWCGLDRGERQAILRNRVESIG